MTEDMEASLEKQLQSKEAFYEASLEELRSMHAKKETELA